MKQAWHIFRKDVRGMRSEVALLAALAIFLGWAETSLSDPSWVELIALLAVNYVVARLIHAEAIPGHNQFWITRPYRWKSLLAAKLLFVLLCIQLPAFLAQIYMVIAGHFPFASSLPGLMWSQVTILLLGVVPVACLASLTGGIIPFVFCEFLVVAAALAIATGMIPARLFSMLPAMQAGPDAMGWVRSSFAAIVLGAFAAFVLFRQYRDRKTSANRIWGAAGIVMASSIFLLMPWSLALGVQAGLSKQPFNSSGLSAAMESVKKSIFPIRGRDQIGPNEVSLPMAIRGVPAGMDTVADALFVTLTGANGSTWRSGLVPVFVRPGEPGTILINADLIVEPRFFSEESAHPVTVSAKLFLTFFGNSASQTIPIQQIPVNVMDGLQCSEGMFLQFNCRSIFRWPRRRVYASANSGGSESSVSSISYSPFPANPGFGSIEQHSFAMPYAASEATITTKEPVSHFAADLTIPNVVLARYTQEAKRRADIAAGTTGTR